LRDTLVLSNRNENDVIKKTGLRGKNNIMREKTSSTGAHLVKVFTCIVLALINNGHGEIDQFSVMEMKMNMMSLTEQASGAKMASSGGKLAAPGPIF
jgi:hypothetical protein